MNLIGRHPALSGGPSTLLFMKPIQQELPLPKWGGRRRGAGRKRKSARRKVPHQARPRFRKGTFHVTVRIREEIWSMRTHRCFRMLRRSFQRGCERFGFRLIHFSVQGNHAHYIVEAPDQLSLTRAMKGLAVRMARALNKVMRRRGAVFADRYHARRLRSPREAAYAVSYVLENRMVHAHRAGLPLPLGVDPCCSEAWRNHSPPLVAQPLFWMLCVGVPQRLAA